MLSVPFTKPLYVPKLKVPLRTVTDSSLDGSRAASPVTAPPSCMIRVCLPLWAAASISTFSLLELAAREAKVPEYEYSEELVKVKLTVALCAFVICNAPPPSKPPTNMSDVRESHAVASNKSHVRVPARVCVIST